MFVKVIAEPVLYSLLPLSVRYLEYFFPKFQAMLAPFLATLNKIFSKIYMSPRTLLLTVQF